MPRISYSNTNGFYLDNELVDFTSGTANSIFEDASPGVGVVTGNFVKLIHDESTGEDKMIKLNDPSWEWSAKISSTEDDSVSDIKYLTGDAYVTGTYTGDLSFYNKGNTTPEVTLTYINSSGNNGFVAKINASGIWQWASKIVPSNGLSGGSFSSGSGNIEELKMTITGENINIFGWFSGPGPNISFFNEDSALDTPDINIVPVDTAGDVFVAQINTSGTWQWVARVASELLDSNVKMIANETDLYVILSYIYLTTPLNFYNAGNANNLAAVPDFTVDLESSGNTDICIAKIDSSGTWQWAARMGSVGDNVVYDLLYDNGLYLTGTYDSSMNFYDRDESDIGGTANADMVTVVDSGTECFIAKIDTSGFWQWTARYNSSVIHSSFTSPIPTDLISLTKLVVIDSAVYAIGIIEADTDFYNSGQTDSAGIPESDLVQRLHSNDEHLVVGRINGGGKWTWTASIAPIENNGTELIIKEVLTLDDEIYIAFNTEVSTNTLQFYSAYEGDSGNQLIKMKTIGNTSGVKDTWVAKIDINGEWQWASKISSSTGDKEIIDMHIVDKSLMITGCYTGDVTFYNQGRGREAEPDITLDHFSGNDTFLAKLNKSGKWEYTVRVAGSNVVRGTKITVGNNDTYIAGIYDNTSINFYNIDQSSPDSDLELDNSGNYDIYIAKYRNNIYSLLGITIGTSGNLSFKSEGPTESSDYPSFIPLKKYYYKETSPYLTTEKTDHFVGYSTSSSELILKQI